jgi:4-alpha-glucanotransferase
MEQTSSFKHLEHSIQNALKELYVDYFFKRQDSAWEKEAMEKLPMLKLSTDMLICGEDLGLVPSCVPNVMYQLGMLSLEVQRMPKANHKTFFHPNDAPYLSVVTPSSHDTRTVRGWWEEDRASTQLFYNRSYMKLFLVT